MTTDSARLWWLTTQDPDTGASTRIVGVAGTAGTSRWVSWMPHIDSVELWRHLLDDLATAAAVRQLLADREGAGSGLATIRIDPPPAASDLAGRVEAALDAALSDAITTVRS